MIIYPAIDLYQGKAVRLYKGDYDKMTVYSEDPKEIAKDFKRQGAKHVHVVDLEGAKTGETPNFNRVLEIVNEGLFTEVGGGIRSIQVVEKYLSAGVDRVILGTSAITDKAFLESAIKTYGEKIAVGVDIKDGFVAIKGWVEKSQVKAFDFLSELQEKGVSTIICTDISKDGAMKGENFELYKEIGEKFKLKVIASGGVSSIEGVKRLANIGTYGAIIGKAYYTKAIDLEQAIKVSK